MKYQIASNSIQGEQYCPMWMDRHDKVNCCFLQFVDTPKNQLCDIAHSQLCHLQKKEMSFIFMVPCIIH